MEHWSQSWDCSLLSWEAKHAACGHGERTHTNCYWKGHWNIMKKIRKMFHTLCYQCWYSIWILWMVTKICHQTSWWQTSCRCRRCRGWHSLQQSPDLCRWTNLPGCSSYQDSFHIWRTSGHLTGVTIMQPMIVQTYTWSHHQYLYQWWYSGITKLYTGDRIYVKCYPWCLNHKYIYYLFNYKW